MASSSPETESTPDGHLAAEAKNLSELCTCAVSTVTFRFERSDDCPIHERPRVTYDSIAWDTGAPAMETIEDLENGAVRVMERIPARPNVQARARAALVWAWKASGLETHEPVRTWNQWLADSKRVWRAWREAGSPIKAFGKDTSFGPVSIPVLEDGWRDR